MVTPGAEFLFGDDLCKSVKDLSETSKVGFDLAMAKKYRYQPTFAGVKDNKNNNYSYRNATKNNCVETTVTFTMREVKTPFQQIRVFTSTLNKCSSSKTNRSQTEKKKKKNYIRREK